MSSWAHQAKARDASALLSPLGAPSGVKVFGTRPSLRFLPIRSRMAFPCSRRPARKAVPGRAMRVSRPQLSNQGYPARTEPCPEGSVIRKAPLCAAR